MPISRQEAEERLARRQAVVRRQREVSDEAVARENARATAGAEKAANLTRGQKVRRFFGARLEDL